MRAPVVCSIGATEPWNAAGLGLDILALAENGARAVTVVAGVTAQDAGGLKARMAVPSDLIASQFAALATADIAAYRIGVLLDAATVGVVAAHVANGAVPVVYDPVLAASAGGTFADEALEHALVARLVPHVRLLTPNLAEAARLTGAASIDDVDGMERAGRSLCAAGAGAVLVKGGHLAGAAVDVLVEGTSTTLFEAPRLAGTLRGTGCLLACAIAAGLARGEPLRSAVDAARAYVRIKLQNARRLGAMRVAF